MRYGKRFIGSSLINKISNISHNLLEAFLAHQLSPYALVSANFKVNKISISGRYSNPDFLPSTFR